MPPSPTKAMLKDAHIELPESLDNDTWLVYRLAGGRTVSFSTNTGRYSLIRGDHAESFADIEALTARLGDG